MNTLIKASTCLLLLAASLSSAHAQPNSGMTIADPFAGTYDLFLGDTGPRFGPSGAVTSSNGIINPDMITVTIRARRGAPSLYDVTRTMQSGKTRTVSTGIGQAVYRSGSALPARDFSLQGRKVSGLLAEGKLLVRWLGDDAPRLEHGDLVGLSGRLAGKTSRPSAPTYDGMDPLASTADYRFLAGRIEGTVTTYAEDENGSTCGRSTFEQGARRGEHPDVIGSQNGEYLIRPLKPSRLTIRLSVRPASTAAARRLGPFELKRTVGNQAPEFGFGIVVGTAEGPLLFASFTTPQAGQLGPVSRMASYWIHSATGRVVGLEQVADDAAPIKTAGWKTGTQNMAGKAIDAVVRNVRLLPAETLQALHAALLTAYRSVEGLMIRFGQKLCVVGEALVLAAGHTVHFVLDTAGALIEVVVDTGRAIHRYVLKPIGRLANQALSAGYELIRDAATGAWRLVVRTAVGTYEFLIRPVTKATQAAVVSGYRTWSKEVRRADGKLDGTLGE